VPRLHASPLMRAGGQNQRRCDQGGPADQQHEFPCRLPWSLEAGCAGQAATTWRAASTRPRHCGRVEANPCGKSRAVDGRISAVRTVCITRRALMFSRTVC